jgi:cyclopropane fatty-acyl-phospholipid synthase-like methyltransferase
LQKTLKSNVPEQGEVIELGCGAGNYVIWFAKMGYRLTGVDISKNAIEIARRSATMAGVNCGFVVADVTRDFPKFDTLFDFVYDWELLHHIFPEDRDRYVDNVIRLMKPEGMYLSVCFCDESPQFGGKGKYRKTPLNTILYFSTEDELRSLFEKYYDIEDLKTIDIKGKNVVHKAIYALMRKQRNTA